MKEQGDQLEWNDGGQALREIAEQGRQVAVRGDCFRHLINSRSCSLLRDGDSRTLSELLGIAIDQGAASAVRDRSTKP